MAELQRGVVKWFNDAKGFGFIEHTSGRDVFVHYSVIEWDGFKTLKDGEEVDYELSEGDKGLHAARVVRVAPKTTVDATSSNGASTIQSAIEIEREMSADPAEPVFAGPEEPAEKQAHSTE